MLLHLKGNTTIHATAVETTSVMIAKLRTARCSFWSGVKSVNEITVCGVCQ